MSPYLLVHVCACMYARTQVGKKDTGLMKAATPLRVVTWNIAAVNNNPFEYWVCHTSLVLTHLVLTHVCVALCHTSLVLTPLISLIKLQIHVHTHRNASTIQVLSEAFEVLCIC